MRGSVGRAVRKGTLSALLVAVVGAFCVATAPARADVTLSWGVGSTTNTSATPQDATATFSINNTGQLELAVSGISNGWDVSAVAWNTIYGPPAFDTDYPKLSLVGLLVGSEVMQVSDWKLNNVAADNDNPVAVNPDGVQGQSDGFGRFTWNLESNAQQGRIGEDGATFTFDIDFGTNPSLTAAAWLASIATTWSKEPAEHGTAIATMHFTPTKNGPYVGDASFYETSVVPEGASLALMAGGLLPLLGGLALFRRRQNA